MKILYKKLDDSYKNDFSKGRTCEDFLDVAEEIISLKDPDSIAVLIKYFSDSSDYDWVLESLQGYLEHFDNEDYVVGILGNLSEVDKRSPEWAEILILSIINNRDCYKILMNQTQFIKDNNFLRSVLLRISNKYKGKKIICNQLISKC